MKIKFNLKKKKPLAKKIGKLEIPKRTKWFVVILVLAFLLGVFVYNYKHWLVVALVDYRPITRLELNRELERQGGKQVLESLINEKLIKQEAKRRRLEANSSEVNEKVSKIEEELKNQGMSLEDVLKLQGQSRSEFIEQVKIQVIIDKILSENIEVSEDEVKKYFEDNQAFYPEGTEYDEVKEELKETLKQQKVGEKFQQWLEDLKSKARINYFTTF